MNKRGWLSLIIIVVVLLVGGILLTKVGLKKTSEKLNVTSEGICEVDDDCVPASCCHPKSCVTKKQQPNCIGYCTQDCEPGTLDCGQGSCKCIDNKCEAMFK